MLLGLDGGVRCLLAASAYCVMLRGGTAVRLIASAGFAVVAVALIATLFHECVHRNLRVPHRAQNWIARVLAAPFGLSLAWWRIKHIRLHHPHVGTALDPDIQFTSVGRVRDQDPWRPIHRFQQVVLPMLWPLAAINMLRPWEMRRVNPNGSFLTLVRSAFEKYGLFTAFWGSLVVAAGPIPAGAMFLTVEVVAGTFGSLVVQLQHNTEASRRLRGPFPSNAALQVASTADTRSRLGIWWWLSGGTSRHVAHHLYPRLTYVQLPRATRHLKTILPAWPEHAHVLAGVASHMRLMARLARPAPIAVPNARRRSL